MGDEAREQSDRSSVPLLWVVVACLSAVLIPQSWRGQTSVEPARSEEKKISSPAATPQSKVQATIEGHFPPVEQGRSLRSIYLANDRVRFLIALVPDPQDTRLGYQFDQFVSAIEQGIQRSGFVLDRWWLPWKPLTTASDKDCEQQATGIDSSDAAERHLGVAVYRAPAVEGKQCEPSTTKPSPAEAERDGKSHTDLLIVFFVGESPTAGVHKPALLRALELEHSVEKRNLVNDELGPVRIVGPAYSGSQQSLEQVIKYWHARQHKLGQQNQLLARLEDQLAFLFGRRQSSKSQTDETIEFVSGSATTFDRECFREHLEGRASFHATVHHEKAYRTAILAYLAKLQGHFKIALLTEGATQYGQVTARQKSDSGSSNLDLINFQYPLHVGLLRSVYATGRETPSPLIDSPAGKSVIPLKADKGQDTIPALTPGMTSASMEMVVANLFSALEREDCHYVLIEGSDVRDIIFLAQMLRLYAPHAQLITTEADLLLTRPEELKYFNGALVVSTYPLASANQRWTYPYLGNSKRRQFSSTWEQGYYNATLAQLDRADLMLEYAPPFQLVADFEKDWRPPVWISAVGPRGLWPIAVQLSEDDPAEYLFRGASYQAEKDGADKAPMKPQVVIPNEPLTESLLLVVGIGGLCLAYRYWKDAPRTEPAELADHWYKLIFRPLTAGQASQKIEAWYEWHLLAGATVMFSLFAYCLRLTLIPVAAAFQSNLGLALDSTSLLPWSLAFATVSAAALAWLLVLALHRRGGLDKRPAARSTANWACAIGVLIVGWTLWDWWSFCGADRATLMRDELLWFSRSIHLTNGVSPFLTILCLAALLLFWLVVRLRHMLGAAAILAEVPVPGESLTGPSKLVFDAVRFQAGRLCDRLQSIEPCSRMSIWALLVVVAILAELWPHFGVAMEPSPWAKPLIFCAISLLLLLIAAMLIRFNAVSRKFHELTRAMAQLPLARSFHDLPGEVTRLVGRLFAGERPRKAEGDRLSLHQLELVRGPLQKHVSRIEIEQHLRQWAPESEDQWADLLDKIAGAKTSLEAAQLCCQLAAWHWPRLQLEEAFPGPVKLKDKETGKYEPAKAEPPSWLTQIQTLIALEMAIYLRQFIFTLRNMARFLAVAPMGLIFALNLYPFHPHGFVLLLGWGLVIPAAIVLGNAFRHMEHDELVSRLTNTDPYKIKWDKTLAQHLFLMLVPLVLLVVAQFPEFSDLLAANIGPLFRAPQ